MSTGNASPGWHSRWQVRMPKMQMLDTKRSSGMMSWDLQDGQSKVSHTSCIVMFFWGAGEDQQLPAIKDEDDESTVKTPDETSPVAKMSIQTNPSKIQVREHLQVSFSGTDRWVRMNQLATLASTSWHFGGYLGGFAESPEIAPFASEETLPAQGQGTREHGCLEIGKAEKTWTWGQATFLWKYTYTKKCAENTAEFRCSQAWTVPQQSEETTQQPENAPHWIFNRTEPWRCTRFCQQVHLLHCCSDRSTSEQYDLWQRGSSSRVLKFCSSNKTQGRLKRL